MTARTRKTTASVKASPVKRTTGKAAPVKVTRAPATLDSSSTGPAPKDPETLRKLIKITRDRRWRAGRRGDDQLVAEMNERLDVLLGNVKAPVKRTARKAAAPVKAARKAAPVKVVPARRAPVKRAVVKVVGRRRYSHRPQSGEAAY